MSFEDRLRDSFHSAGRSIPEDEVPWEPTITRARRARARRLAVVTAAAVLIVGGGAWSAATLLPEPAEDPIPPAPPSETQSPDLESPGPEETQTSEDEELSSAVRARVMDWVKALSLGDAETAWSFMSARTHAHYGNDIENFKGDMSGFSEGFGAWYAEFPPETTFRVLVSSGDGIAGIVEIHGPVQKEGNDELGHDAVPVRVVDGEVFVEPFSSEVELSPVEPSLHESYAAGQIPAEFAIRFEDPLEQVNFFHESSEDTTDAEIVPGPRGSRAHSPAPHDLSPGPKFLTVAGVDIEGGIAVLVVPYFVE